MRVRLPVVLIVLAIHPMAGAWAADAIPEWLYRAAQASPMVGSSAATNVPAAASACGACHGANGMGSSESAPIAGLPVNYFVAQMQAFRNGTRRSAHPRKADTEAMIALAKQMSDAQIREAATYFAGIKPLPVVRVVETDKVPLPGGKQDALGQRIVELPDPQNPGRYVAYVPPRSLNRGAVVVTTGRSKTQPCGACHGTDLKGKDDVPAIAGRSPTYLMRQLVDMRAHTRLGKGVESMRSFYEVFSDTDLLAVSAFVASRAP